MTKGIEARLFAEWAGKRLDRWDAVNGCVAHHRIFGPCTVIAVRADYGDIAVETEYSSADRRQYLGSSFGEPFRYVEIETALADRIRQEREPGVSRRRRELQLKVESGATLQPTELRWLGMFDEDKLLKIYLERHGANWPLATVAAYWRTCNRPQRNIDITAVVENETPRKKSSASVWTTRGAAFADLEDMHEAYRCATASLECNPEGFHVHNLLGRIHRSLGNDEKADFHFEEAKRLGSDAQSIKHADLQGQSGRVLSRDEP